MAGMSFEEYVNAYYRGGLDISARYGIRKDELRTDGAGTSDAAYFNTMYGASVFNQLNTKSDVFKLFRKEGWTQSGWRVLTARTVSGSNTGVAEGGAFGASDVPDLALVEADIKEIVSPYTVTTKAAILAEADDGVKGLATFLRAQAAEAHSFYIDKMMLAQPAAGVAGDNMESLYRIVGNNGQLDLNGYDANEMDVYNLDRDAGTSWADAYVNNGAFTGSAGSRNETERALTLDLLDATIQNAIENGAQYSDLIFLMGHQQLTELKQLITKGSGAGATWRMALEAQAPKGTNGVASEPGMNLDGRMGYYDSIPIYATQHMADALTSSSGGSTASMGPILLLDMKELYIKVAAPTTFLAQEDLANVQALKRNYAFMTAGEVICTKFKSQGLIRGLELGA
tara:strand:- start:5209 stop:6405 length:1197 start_codon:yes stop_codon:yes gene_type:complete